MSRDRKANIQPGERATPGYYHRPAQRERQAQTPRCDFDNRLDPNRKYHSTD